MGVMTGEAAFNPDRIILMDACNISIRMAGTAYFLIRTPQHLRIIRLVRFVAPGTAALLERLVGKFIFLFQIGMAAKAAFGQTSFHKSLTS